MLAHADRIPRPFCQVKETKDSKDSGGAASIGCADLLTRMRCERQADNRLYGQDAEKVKDARPRKLRALANIVFQALKRHGTVPRVTPSSLRRSFSP